MDTPKDDPDSPEEGAAHPGADAGPSSWAEAWSRSPGPRTGREALLLGAKGFAMGTADIIPGVSGGTVAFITGIYQDLLDAIASFDAAFLRHLLAGRFRRALAHAHLRFLAALLGGIGLAILGTARLMHYLITDHPVPTWSLFFGLIAGSILVVGRQVPDLVRGAPFLLLGAAAAWLIVGLIPVETPETWWFLVLSGAIAICAMILPGISGSFLLLILGKYAYVTGAVKDPLRLESLGVLLLFGAGCVGGLLLFSRLLGWCLRHARGPTLCVLTGFMIGAMRKIWPWKEVVRTAVIGGKERILETRNVLPGALDGGVLLALLLAAAGFVGVLLLERLSRDAPPPDTVPSA